ncbi:hypothetical protein OsJ_17675 [Oryza sativa Japonica Group]|uniref:Disease resistance R13L4/SHOC-2-like LRR domain-containing protein n=1 Tax=Oryza sativa subsp. japonica TaxID=39947 RepID=B9FNB2_ORYSJ|nr:hypothetical protein OsJ_17675 [Oryza sativa Japonica Group]
MQEIMGKCSQLRSLNYYGVQDVGPDLQTLHCLRVLVFENCHGIGTQHIKHLESFFRLAYLSISSDGITELPEQIGDLKYLQTLDIRHSGIKKLPPTIGRLQNLARLLVGNDVELPNEIGDLQALQELSDAGKYDSIKFVQELRRLTRLSVLRIMLHDSNKLGDHNTENYEESLKSSLAMMEETGSKIGFEFGFEHLASLQQLSVTVDCRGATRQRVEAAEAAMRDAASIHPGRPALEISRRWERDMIKDKDDHEEIVQVE